MIYDDLIERLEKMVQDMEIIDCSDLCPDISAIEEAVDILKSIQNRKFGNAAENSHKPI